MNWMQRVVIICGVCAFVGWGLWWLEPREGAYSGRREKKPTKELLVAWAMVAVGTAGVYWAVKSRKK